MNTGSPRGETEFKDDELGRRPTPAAQTKEDGAMTNSRGHNKRRRVVTTLGGKNADVLEGGESTLVRTHVQRLFRPMLNTYLRGFEVPETWPKALPSGCITSITCRNMCCAKRGVSDHNAVALQSPKLLLETSVPDVLGSAYLLYMQEGDTSEYTTQRVSRLVLRVLHHNEMPNIVAHQQSCPERARMLVRGIPKHEEVLKELLCDPNTMILYPSESSIHIREFLKIRAKRATKSDGKDEKIQTQDQQKELSSGQQERPINILGLDGTWSQARQLRRYLDKYSTIADAGRNSNRESIDNDDTEGVTRADGGGGGAGEGGEGVANEIKTSQDGSKRKNEMILPASKHKQHDAQPNATRCNKTGKFQQIEMKAKFVHVDVTEPSIFHPLRRQVRQDGCCTLEAMIYALKEVGEEKAAADLKSTLRIFVDALLIQSRKPPVYGTFTEDECRKMSHAIQRKKCPF
eukprot:jgi/Bigna1/79943/fgenesh1_pg.66_\